MSRNSRSLTRPEAWQPARLHRRQAPWPALPARPSPSAGQPSDSTARRGSLSVSPRSSRGRSSPRHPWPATGQRHRPPHHATAMLPRPSPSQPEACRSGRGRRDNAHPGSPIPTDCPKSSASPAHPPWPQSGTADPAQLPAAESRPLPGRNPGLSQASATDQGRHSTPPAGR